MSKAFTPDLPYNTPLYLLIPSYEDVKGVTVKKYPKPSKDLVIFAKYRTFGGTETEKNGVYSVIDTASVETWFRPDVKSDCRLMREDGAVYEIMGDPENIELRNQFLKFKVQRVKGGA